MEARVLLVSICSLLAASLLSVAGAGDVMEQGADDSARGATAAVATLGATPIAPSLFHFSAVSEADTKISLLDRSEPFSARAWQDDANDPAPALHPQFGAKDSRRLNFSIGYGEELDPSSHKEYLLGFGMEWFVEDDFSLIIELNGFHFDQANKDAQAINFNLLMRWHCLTWETWSIYLDGGVGLMLSSDEVPNTGSTTNFTPQLGGGFSFDVGNDNRLLVGVRWHHISNARVFEDNPGRDQVLLYLGLSIPW